MRAFAVISLSILILHLSAAAQISGTSSDSRYVGGPPPEDNAKILADRRAYCRQMMDTCKARIAKNAWQDARIALETAAKHAVDADVVPELQQMARTIDEAGQSQLKTALALQDTGKYAEALKMFQGIADIYGSLPSGKDAREKVKQMEADENVQALLQEARAAPLSAAIDRSLGLSAPTPTSQPTTMPTSAPARADRLAKIRQLPPDRQLYIVDSLKTLAGAFAKSPSGKQAQADLDAMLTDTALQEQLARERRKQEARSAWNMVEMYRRSGMDRQADEKCRQLIQDYPDSPEAQLAKSAGSSTGQK